MKIDSINRFSQLGESSKFKPGIRQFAHEQIAKVHGITPRNWRTQYRISR